MLWLLNLGFTLFFILLIDELERFLDWDFSETIFSLRAGAEMLGYKLNVRFRLLLC